MSNQVAVQHAFNRILVGDTDNGKKLKENISQLISSNVEATQYFNSLSAEMQQKILDRGTGVNTLDKLKEFKNLVENNGLK